eukprot:CAMPEP_0183733182 /NCGR_PEP_ID=MMETSP0737-20130205/40400_1 /TAXON_ID=385413 /ORGANISM="Thalassiosira miniscula, Strain CCMP1093" /LENGTH=372 /DNA_ID=CAMNT_0025966381 /DNA_START=59 /DNA_END=1174 /DNA_ORIENTATION=-
MINNEVSFITSTKDFVFDFEEKTEDEMTPSISSGESYGFDDISDSSSAEFFGYDDNDENENTENGEDEMTPESSALMAETKSRTKIDAKETFKRLLSLHNGDVSHPGVVEALEDLVQHAASEREDNNDSEWSPAHGMWYANQGRWKSITAPPFTGRLPGPDHANQDCKFTLGRMSFGMFKPTDTICVVEDIIITIDPIEGECKQRSGKRRSEIPAWSQTYTVEVLLDLQGPATTLPAKLTNHGICYPISPTRVGIKFSRGTLEPRFDLSRHDAGGLASAWTELFDNAIAKETESRPYLDQVSTWVSNGFLKMAVGLEPPSDELDLTQTYKIQRPRRRHMDIVYLDEDFRVSRHRGTIVVEERIAEEEPDCAW